MEQICILIPLEPYLSQWLINQFGGAHPIKLPKNSVEAKLLSITLTTPPPDTPPQISQPSRTSIIIPQFRNRPPQKYSYLPHAAQNALIRIIKNRFDVSLWNDLHSFGAIGRRQDYLIYAWMETNAIEPTETNWNAIAKRYQRQRTIYAKRLWAARDRNRRKKQ